MEKRVILAVFFALALTASITSAESNSTEQKAYDWLANKSVNGNYGNDISTTALAGLAFKNVGYDGSAKASADWILMQKDPQNCFPKGDCKTKDTALALMLLNSLSMPEASGVQKWLEGAQSAATTSGKWMLEISTQATGKCVVSYQIKNKSFSEEVNVEQGKFPKCGGSNFLDMDSCFKSGLIRSEPGIKFTVDCSSLTGETPIVTLVYNSGSTFYIISTQFGSVADVTIANGCYGKTAKAPCSKESTLYANWALSQASSTANANLYLLENYDAASIADNSLLYQSFLTKDEKYLEAIKTRQSADGSLNRDFYQTSLAILALEKSQTYSEKAEKAKEWLASKQEKDGSWAENAKDSAMVLYAAFADAVLKPEVIKAATEEEASPCDYNFVCDEESGETPEGCTDCAVINKEEGACNTNNECETDLGETAENCVDCSCGDSICDSSESFDSCSSDCEEETTSKEEGICGDGACDTGETAESCAADCKATSGMGFGTILVIILVALLIGVGAYFAYNKLNKPSQKTTSAFGAKPGYMAFKRPQQPAQAAKPPAKAKGSESELEKSLEEARKLLRK